MSRETSEYAAISARQQALVRKICDNQDDESLWAQFYDEIKERLIVEYVAVLEKDKGLTVEEFWVTRLRPHFTENDCEFLLKFLSMVDNGREYVHFGNARFLLEIKSVYNATPDVGVSVSGQKAGSLDVPVDGERSEDDTDTVGSRIADVRSGPDELVCSDDYDRYGLDVLRNTRNADDAAVLNNIVRKQWPKYPRDCYLAVCYSTFKVQQQDISVLLGLNSENSVAQHLRRWRGRMLSCYKAQMDGEIELFDLKRLAWSWHDFIFDFGKSRVGALSAVFHLPFIVERQTLIRIVVSGVASGWKLEIGNKCVSLSQDGTGEITVSDFAANANSADVVLIAPNGKRLPGRFGGSADSDTPICLTVGNLARWAELDVRKANLKSVVAKLLNEFGPVLSQLLVSPNMLRTLPFERFGVPVLPREKLRHVGGEAWILVRQQGVCEGSVLDPNGFMLPVEWVGTASREAYDCPSIPRNLKRVSWIVQAAFGEDGHWWGIQPAERFFADRLQIEDGLFGFDEVQVASSAVALGVALRYAIDGYDNPVWPFVSAQFNPRANRIGPVGGIAAKMSVAKEYGADCVCVAAGQEGLPSGKDWPSARVLKSTDLKAAVAEVAYGHLAKFMPDVPTSFGPIDGWHPSRGGIIEKLTAPLNDDDDRELVERGRYMVLFGPPGIGKSTLMAELEERQSGAHICITYVCRAGVPDQGIAFVKAIAYGLACRIGDYAKELQSMKPLPKTAAGNELKTLYRDYVYQPFRDLASRRKKQPFNLIVDGVDEDVSGEILNLLTDPSLRYNRNISVAISSRPVAQAVDRLKACATKVIDLKCGDKPNVHSVADKNRWIIKTLIRHGLLFHPRIKDAFAKSGLDVDETVERIYNQEGTFLYANAVLTGIDTGVYFFSQLEKELPCGIRACYYDRFKKLFPNAKAYTRVKPLLKPLVEHGECEEQTLGERIVRDNDERIGTLIQLMGGYVERKNGMLRLTSESLREWLSDLAGNPEFSVAVKKKRGRMS